MAWQLRYAISLAALAALLCSTACGAGPSAKEIEQITAAMPKTATARPAAPRRLLVYTRCNGFRHDSIPHATEALEIMGKATGAFAVTVSDDPAVFEPASLAAFDAVCLNNTTGDFFPMAMIQGETDEQKRQTIERLKSSLLDFVAGGKGLVGIHAATDCNYGWPAFGAMIGGYFRSHPWNEKVGIRLDDPAHPLSAAFDGDGFDVADEIYQFKDPYSRANLRVLLSLDMNRTPPKGQRWDGDYAVAWVRAYGKGRVFYCSLGHRNEIFRDPKLLRFYLDGIQFALGDLAADTTPSARLEQAGWQALFNGKDLTGWKGLVGNPKTRAEMTAEQLAAAQKKADEQMRAHWTVAGGALCFDGKGSHLATGRDYDDFEMVVDWRISPGGDSGIYLRGSPQVQIWDTAKYPEGSGGLYNNRKNPPKPLARADRPVGEWNTFFIRMVGERVTVYLNDVLVVKDTPLENYWERDKPIYDTGQIELQSHGTRLWFRNIYLRGIPRGK